MVRKNTERQEWIGTALKHAELYAASPSCQKDGHGNALPSALVTPLFGTSEIYQVGSECQEMPYGPLHRFSQESTPTSSTELPPFVSTGSKDPNLGI